MLKFVCRSQSLNNVESEGSRSRAKSHTISHPVTLGSIPDSNFEKTTKTLEEGSKKEDKFSKRKESVKDSITPLNSSVLRAHDKKSSLKQK